MSAFWDLECNQIDAAARAVEDRKKKYLRSSGWEYTSDTIDHRWRWFKEIDGRQYGTDLEDAFGIQKKLDSRKYAEANPSEFED